MRQLAARWRLSWIASHAERVHDLLVGIAVPPSSGQCVHLKIMQIMILRIHRITTSMFNQPLPSLLNNLTADVCPSVRSVTPASDLIDLLFIVQYIRDLSNPYV